MIAYPLFRAALDSGDLARVLQLAREMPPMRLDDALRVCLLLRDGDSERFERAAVRWTGRFALEARNVSLEAIELAITSLGVMLDRPEDAMERLAALCAAHGVR